DLRAYAAGLEEREGVSGRSAEPPALQTGQRVPWGDLERFGEALLRLFDQPGVPLECRLRQWFALAALCRQSKFDAVSGSRLGEFLNFLTQGVAAVVEADPEKVPPPTWVGRILFRNAVAIYARRDTAPPRGLSRHRRL